MLKASKADKDILAEWSSVKQATEDTLQLLETYKAVGDAKHEVPVWVLFPFAGRHS
jgi:hypothetical protein